MPTYANAEDFFDLAAQNARREFGAKRRTVGPTHWSYWDEPDQALCGETIEPEQFNRDPTCPECRTQLAAMKAEDLR